MQVCLCGSLRVCARVSLGPVVPLIWFFVTQTVSLRVRLIIQWFLHKSQEERG